MTYKLTNPCILDIKLGKRTYSPLATNEKMLKEMNKYPLQKVLGVRVVGMKIYHKSTNNFITYGKEQGYGVKSKTDLYSLFDKYFLSEDLSKEINLIILDEFIQKFLQLKKFLEEEKSFNLYSSSILLVYDNVEKINISKIKICLIDFSHVIFGELNTDFNTLFSINNLLAYLQISKKKLSLIK